MQSNQDRFREELRRNGKMRQFKQRVAELRRENLSPSESWNRAASEFGYLELDENGNRKRRFTPEELEAG